MRYLIIVLIASTWANCNKVWDSPPILAGSMLRANLSIRQLRNMHLPGGFERIMEEYIISGQVVANDSSDNLYKTIVLQDSTGGISVRIDASNLYSSFRVGRQVAIRLKDLWLGDYSGMVQLGAGVDRSDAQYPDLIPIPQPLIPRYLLAGTILSPPAPKVVSIAELDDSLQSVLISIPDLELIPQDTGKTYADAVNRLSANRILQSCEGLRLILRTSGFARFAGIKTPRGRGTVTGIYSVFRNDKQLLLRDTSDIQLNDLRCLSSGIKVLLEENFEQTSADPSQPARNWRTYAETGMRVFEQKTLQRNGHVEINAFASGSNTVVSWLVSPPIDLSGSDNERLQFLTKDGFDNGATLQVMISTNYDGGPTPWKAKWTALKANIAKGSINNIAANWLPSGAVSLSSYKGTVYLAFRYEAADPANPIDKRTTRFMIDNVQVVGN